jgi:hypothetical protein
MRFFSSFLLLLVPMTQAFTVKQIPRSHSIVSSTRIGGTSDSFEISIDMPPSNSGLQANMKIPSIISVPSEIVEVRYKLPFGLDVAPRKGMAICTKDGKGGEKVGDVLRYSSQWTMGLPKGDGIISTAASFYGGASWQCSIFNVMKANNWEEVVEALTSNVDVRRCICCVLN